MMLLLGVLSVPQSAPAQIADTLFTWQEYGRRGTCRVRVYETPPEEDRRYTVLLQELAENEGPSIVDDARHLVELIGRQLSIEPTTAYWVFHWGAFAYEGAQPNKRKELFIRATFRRNKQSLSTPHWRVINRDEVREYTDRLFK